MSAQKYVIIGDGIAGAAAAETIRKNDEDVDIKVLPMNPNLSITGLC